MSSSRNPTLSPIKGAPNAPLSWDVSCPVGKDLLPKYDAFSDKYLKFAQRPRTEKALKNLEKQREFYERLLANPGALAALSDFRSQTTNIATKKVSEDEEKPEVVHASAKTRLLLLWDELDIPIDVREHFEATAFQAANVESIVLINDELERLLHVREAQHNVKEAIAAREGFLYLIQDVVEKQGSLDPSPRVVKQLNTHLINVRKVSFDVVDAVTQWRQALGYEAVYLWRGVSYLCKMATDLAFLADTPFMPHIGCAVVGNPFFDMQRKWEAPEGATRKSAPPKKERPEDKVIICRYHRMLPPVKKPQESERVAKASGIYTPEQYETAQNMLLHEFEVYAEYLKTTPQHRFDAPDNATPDADIVRSLEECRFTGEALDEIMNIMTTKELSPEEQMEFDAAIRIQAAYRSHAVRKSVKEVRRMRDAARKIQNWFRSGRAVEERKRRLVRYSAATLIQSRQRGNATRSRVGMQQRRTQAATKIQKVYRGYRDRAAVAHWRCVWRCAVRIQTCFRGFAARRRVQREVCKALERQSSCVEAQERAALAVRNDMVGGNPQKYGRGTKYEGLTVVTIQTWFRGLKAKRDVQKLMQVNRQATKIQAFLAGCAVRSQVKEKGSSSLDTGL